MNDFAKPNLAVDQIPSASAADKDKVLTIDANGVPVWAENQGGGGGGGVTIVHGTVDMETEDVTLDMKAGELYEQCESGAVIVRIETSTGFFEEYGHTEAGYLFKFGDVDFEANTADDYPVFSGGGK